MRRAKRSVRYAPSVGTMRARRTRRPATSVTTTVKPSPLDALAGLGGVLEAGEDVAAHRLHGLLLGLEDDAHVALEIGEQHAAVHVDDAAAAPVDRGDLLVGLVADLADDLLDQVLDGDEPDELRAHRGDDAHRRLPGLHLQAEPLHGGVFPGEDGLAQQLGDAAALRRPASTSSRSRRCR